MTRRVLAALLGLIVLLLAGVVVPLGALTARADKQHFVQETAATAGTLAALAEEHLADHRDEPLPGLTQLGGGEHATYAVYDATGTLVEGDTDLADGTALRTALAGRTARVSGEEDLTVVAPVRGHNAVIGAVALRRSTEDLSADLRRLWLSLAGAGAGAAVLATLLAVALARWVGRPLHRLEVTAARLGEGDLDERVRLTRGPPEVRQLARSFDEMAGRLETLVHGHRSLVADVSHQLRTPLAAMRLRMELLQQDLHSAPAQELSGVLAEVTRLSRLVDGLLAVARAEHATSRPEPLEAADVLDDRAEAWRPVAGERNIELVVDVRGQPVVAVTPGHLEQVLDNLIANALEATPVGGRVTVSASASGDRVQLMVTDSGPGMTPDQRGRAFRRFWRNGRPSNDGGSGLGLAIVERLVTVDGGTVELDSPPGSGLRVCLEFPASR